MPVPTGRQQKSYASANDTDGVNGAQHSPKLAVIVPIRFNSKLMTKFAEHGCWKG